MRGYWVALIAALGGFLFAGISATGLITTYIWFNYREVRAGEGAMILLADCLLLYLLGVSIIALLLRQCYPRRGQNQPIHKRRALLRFITPVLLTLTLVAVNNYGGIPIAFASAEARQQWAYTEFTDYKYAVDDIQNCQSIKARVGNVKTVAPTWGKNFTVYDHGSSGHRGEFTLEVIGDRGTGVANSSFHIGTSLYLVKFTYEGKTETLTCDNAGQFPSDLP